MKIGDKYLIPYQNKTLIVVDVDNTHMWYKDADHLDRRKLCISFSDWEDALPDITFVENIDKILTR